MRKILIILVVVALAFLGYFFLRNDSTGTTSGNPSVNEAGALKPDPSNATFTFDGEAVTLSGGRAEVSVAPGSAMTEETRILDKFAYADINGDGKEDTLLLLARFGGGSGTFIYLAGFVSGPVTQRGTEAAFIGDRVTPQSISVSGSTITVNYLDRDDDEALAAEPTVKKSKQFSYRNGEFVEK